MAHQRTVIRQAIRDLLIGKTSAEARVQTTRILPYRQSELPALSVYTEGEAVAEDSKGTAPRELIRELEIVIAGWVPASDTIDDDMDALALEIETAMHADPYLGDKAGDSILLRTDLDIEQDGSGIRGLVKLAYAVTYRTLAPEANEGLDDFLKVKADHQIAGVADGSAEIAHDEFVVQEVAP